MQGGEKGRVKERIELMAAVYDQTRSRGKATKTPKGKSPRGVGLHYTQPLRTPHRTKKHSFSPVNRQVQTPAKNDLRVPHLPLLKTSHRVSRATPRSLGSTMIHRRTQSQPDHKQKSIVYAVKSLKGYLPGAAKSNQDSHFCYPCVGGHPQVHAFGVCDGHGQYGLEISKFVVQTLPLVLEKDPELIVDPEKALIASLITVDYDLGQTSIDINFSGTTAVLVLVHQQTVICANVGDSRAFIARKSGADWQALPISRDHKPSEPDEAARIREWNGRIEPYYDKDRKPLGPLRVWLPDEDIPGLAMTRSIGDHIAALAGVTSQPEIRRHELEDDDKFLVMGSDGLFEFLSNSELLDLSTPFFEGKNARGAVEKLVQSAEAKWRKVIDR